MPARNTPPPPSTHKKHIPPPAVKKNLRQLFINHPPTNQVFIVMENEAAAQLARKAEISLWEKYDDKHTIVRFVTDWATQQRDVDMLIEILEQGHNSGLACVS